MSGKKSDYVVKKYGLHEVAPLCPSNSEQRLIKKPENSNKKEKDKIKTNEIKTHRTSLARIYLRPRD